MRALLVLSGLMLSLSLGCSAHLAPVYSPTSPAGLDAAGHKHSVQAVHQAVMLGLSAKRWIVLKSEAQVVVARSSGGGLWATVQVEYDETGWRITHVDAARGFKRRMNSRGQEVIHRRYNHWIRLLDDSIRRSLLNAPLPAPSYGSPALAPAAPPTAPPTQPAPLPPAAPPPAPEIPAETPPVAEPPRSL